MFPKKYPWKKDPPGKKFWRLETLLKVFESPGKGNNWYEKYIVNKDKSLDFFEKKIKTELIEKLIKQKIPKNQKFIEYSPLANEKLSIISKIIKKYNGGLLIIDYGYNDKKMFDVII